LIFCNFEKILALTVTVFNIFTHFVIADRVKILKRKVFKFVFDTLDTESMGKRCIDVHGLKRDGTLTAFALGGKRAHIVKPVGKLNENYAYVLGHGKEHFAKVLNAFILFVFKVDIR